MTNDNDQGEIKSFLVKILNNASLLAKAIEEPHSLDIRLAKLQDIEWLYDKLTLFYKTDPSSCAKLMFLLYFSKNQNKFGLQHVFDSIGLYISDAMNHDVSTFIRKEYENRMNDLDEPMKSWWAKEIEVLGCNKK